jgi:hypothetical protein
MPVEATINGKGPGIDRLFASVAGRRFPAPVRLVNRRDAAAHIQLRVRPGSGARLRIEQAEFRLGADEQAETRLEAETPSQAEGDTVLEVVVDGEVTYEFRFTAVSLARESIFHGLGRR